MATIKFPSNETVVEVDADLTPKGVTLYVVIEARKSKAMRVLLDLEEAKRLSNRLKSAITFTEVNMGRTRG